MRIHSCIDYSTKQDEPPLPIVDSFADEVKNPYIMRVNALGKPVKVHLPPRGPLFLEPEDLRKMSVDVEAPKEDDVPNDPTKLEIHPVPKVVPEPPRSLVF